DYLRTRSIGIHQVVMLAFVGERPGDKCVCHNDGDKTNNNLQNLRYDSFSENSKDIVRHGSHHEDLREKCDLGHSFDRYPHTKKHKNKYYRDCLSCTRASRFLQRNPNGKYSYKEIADL